MDEPQLVGDELDDVAGAERSAADHAAKVLQDRNDPVKIGFGPTGEQGETLVAGTIDGAGHGGVHDRDPVGRLVREFLHEFVSVRGEIGPHRAGTQRGERPTRPHHAIDVVGTGERGEQDVGLRSDGCDVVGGSATSGDDLGHRFWPEIQGDDVVTGIDQVEAHGQTHVAEADETDGFRGSCFRHGRS